MNEPKKFAFDVGITFISTIISILLSSVLTIILGRYLGADDLGLFRMVLTIYGITLLIASIGIPIAITKYISESVEQSEKSDAIMSSSIIISLFLGIVVSIFIYFSADVFESIFKFQGLSDLLKLLSPVFPFALISGVLLGLLNGKREMKMYGIATIVQIILMIIISVPLIYSDIGVSGAVIGIVISNLFSCLFLIWVCREYYKIRFKIYYQETKNIIQFGSQVLSASAFNEINNQLDIILIGYFLVSTELGYYSAAISLSRFFWFIPLSIQKITYPATSEYWSNKNHSALSIMTDKTIKYCTIVLLFWGLGMGFYAKEIIIMLFKENFVNSVLPLQILLVGTVIRGCIHVPIGGSLSGIGRPDLSLKISILMITVNIILDVLLIPGFGIIGAAIATSISLILGAFTNLYFVIKKMHIKIDIKWYLKLLILTFFFLVLFKYAIIFINAFILGFIILFMYLILIFTVFLEQEDKDLFKLILNSFIIKKGS